MKVNESDFEYRGYRCVTTFTDLGHRCGYVGLPKGHPLYDKKHDSQLNVTIKETIDTEKEDNKRSILSLLSIMTSEEDEQIELGTYFNVHGGITYADGNGKHPVESDLWWLGFDCGHYRDGLDLNLLEKLWGDDEHIQQRLKFEREYEIYSDYPVRSKEYVQQECRNLVDQIIDLTERYYQ